MDLYTIRTHSPYLLTKCTFAHNSLLFLSVLCRSCSFSRTIGLVSHTRSVVPSFGWLLFRMYISLTTDPTITTNEHTVNACSMTVMAKDKPELRDFWSSAFFRLIHGGKFWRSQSGLLHMLDSQ